MTLRCRRLGGMRAREELKTFSTYKQMFVGWCRGTRMFSGQQYFLWWFGCTCCTSHSDGYIMYPCINEAIYHRPFIAQLLYLLDVLHVNLPCFGRVTTNLQRALVIYIFTNIRLSRYQIQRRRGIQLGPSSSRG